MKYNVKDTVITKKAHPCGGFEWEIVRTGADIKIKCLKCGRIVMLSLPAFEKSVKRITSNNND